MIYDGGSQDDAAKGPNNRLLAYLHAVRPELRTIDHLVLSHPHEDHEVLLPDVFDQFDVRNVWDSGRVQQTVGYCRFLKKASAEPGLIYHGAVADAPHRVRFQAGSCTGDVVLARTQAITSGAVSLSANSQFVVLNADSSPHADPNGNSLVIRLDIGSRRVLLMGDAEGGQRRPLGRFRVRTRSRVACCGTTPGSTRRRPGCRASRQPHVVEAAFPGDGGASVYLISSGPHEYGGVVLPDPEIRDELDRRGDLYLTTVNDIQCLTATAKIGRDKDGKPGGCTNVVVTIGRAICSPPATRWRVTDKDGSGETQMSKSVMMLLAASTMLAGLAAVGSGQPAEALQTVTCARFPAQASSAFRAGVPPLKWRTDLPTALVPTVHPWEQVDFRTDWLNYMAAVLSEVQASGLKIQDNTVTMAPGAEWWIAPWMDYGPNGREAQLGLTKERGPDAGDLSPQSPTGPQVWAIGFYNREGAKALHDIFADPCNPSRPQLGWTFPAKTVSFKLLFTDAAVPYLAGARRCGRISTRPVRHLARTLLPPGRNANCNCCRWTSRCVTHARRSAGCLDLRVAE
ncbi:hypothetical protein H9L14_14095 [Sphingomonas sediminicola]|uniref:Metallo-beta-lactamase domain-containing protein n=1 Tax=Sphingomonas sediminicola TaxID=386874 RepID=A0ABX6T700_9SPHN|nr:hypothetical protein [Sphingomonas sediminicola]QNP45637.1 hypothetical protein H9L14_14095 [Sphingomonas sediminicola]